jgi:hypothetical protein
LNDQFPDAGQLLPPLTHGQDDSIVHDCVSSLMLRLSSEAAGYYGPPDRLHDDSGFLGH